MSVFEAALSYDTVIHTALRPLLSTVCREVTAVMHVHDCRKELRGPHCVRAARCGFSIIIAHPLSPGHNACTCTNGAPPQFVHVHELGPPFVHVREWGGGGGAIGARA